MDYIHKLDGSICRLCREATEEKKIPVIIFTEHDNKQNLKKKIKRLGGNIRYELEILGAYAVDLSAKKIEELARSETVNYIASDFNASTKMDSVRQSIAIDDVSYTGKGVTAAIIDTGVYPHKDLTQRENRIVYFRDYVNNKKKAYDDNGHGTHVAGIMASDGITSGGKYRGIAPGIKIISLKALNSVGEGKVSNILAALDWVWKNHKKYGINIVSLSLGASGTEGRQIDPLIKAAEKLWDSGIVVVAAAGNSGPANFTIDSPGVSPKIITVGCCDDKHTATRKDDTVAEFSSRGPSPYTKYKPDILAPGVNVTSLSNSKDGYVKMSGTSMATPVISGCCALLIEKYPGITPGEIKKRLKNSTYSLGDPVVDQGSGVIDAAKLMLV